MRNLRMIGLAALAALATPDSANAGDRPFTFEQMYMLQKIDGNFPVVYGYESLAKWCSNSSLYVNLLGSYEAAKLIGSQANGVYDCKGQFGRELQSTNLVIYKLESCKPVNQDELRATCPARGQ